MRIGKGRPELAKVDQSSIATTMAIVGDAATPTTLKKLFVFTPVIGQCENNDGPKRVQKLDPIGSNHRTQLAGVYDASIQINSNLVELSSNQFELIGIHV